MQRPNRVLFSRYVSSIIISCLTIMHSPIYHVGVCEDCPGAQSEVDKIEQLHYKNSKMSIAYKQWGQHERYNYQ